MSKVTVKIENDYEDGHHSEREVVLDAPADHGFAAGMEIEDCPVLDEWFNDTVYEQTGDGHGIGGMGSCYTATILAAEDATLVGLEYEWA